MIYISDFTNSLGVAVGKVAVCMMVPKTANLLFGNREMLILQNLEQDLNGQNIGVKIPLFIGCALGLFHPEFVSIITGAKEYAEQIIEKYYGPSIAVQSPIQPELNQHDLHKDVSVHLHHNTSYEELICECHASDGLQGELVG